MIGGCNVPSITAVQLKGAVTFDSGDPTFSRQNVIGRDRLGLARLDDVEK